MSLPFDAALKNLIGQHPADLGPVFHLPALEPVVPLNVDLSTVTAATDVAFGFGQPLRTIVDLNFQSGPDPNLASRLLLYNAAFHLKFDVPVRSVLVLLRPKADHKHLTGKMAYAEGGKRVRFEYEVIRLWKQPVQPFLQGGVGLLPLATLCRLPEGKSKELALREIDRRLVQEVDRPQAQRLMTVAFILTGLRLSKEDLPFIYQGVTIMHESTAFDTYFDEGHAKGFEEGQVAGQAAGEIRQCHLLLLRQGEKRFGAAKASTKKRLNAITDLARLERMADAILTAASWDDLLATS